MSIGAIDTIIIGFGTYYIYRCNGGENGERFLERYICLGWVVAIRWTVLFVTPTMVAFFVGNILMTEMLGEEMSEETDIFDMIFFTLVTLSYYYILGRHTRSVAMRTPQAVIEPA